MFYKRFVNCREKSRQGMSDCKTFDVFSEASAPNGKFAGPGIAI